MIERNKIIIADDIASNRLVCRDILRQAFPQFEYELFENSDSLKSRLEKGVDGAKVAVIDNDYQSGLYGHEIIHEYAPRPEYASLKFILYSSDPDEEIERRVVADGAIFLIKPAGKTLLIETVRKALEGK